MRRFLPIISLLGLALVLGAPVLYFLEGLEKPAMSAWMLTGTLGWFLTVPFWLGRGKE